VISPCTTQASPLRQRAAPRCIKVLKRERAKLPKRKKTLSGSHRLTGSRMGITMLMHICHLLVSKARGSRC
jgi:hypothetical protein